MDSIHEIILMIHMTSVLLQQLHRPLHVLRLLQGPASFVGLEAHVQQHLQRLRRRQEQLRRRVQVAATALQRSATGGHVVAAELPCKKKRKSSRIPPFSSRIQAEIIENSTEFNRIHEIHVLFSGLFGLRELLRFLHGSQVVFSPISALLRASSNGLEAPTEHKEQRGIVH